jgi:penicillin-binding protein 1A
VGGGIAVGVLLLAVIGVVAYVLHVAQSTPALASLHPKVSGGSSQVFASDGTPLGFIQSDELRTPVHSQEIPQNLKNGTVAIEDQRFYTNDGIDLTSIFRSAIKDVTSGSALQGGSTITMQLMRNLYLGGDTHSLRQKIEEAKLAIDYTKHHSKASILTSYLNSVPYGTVGGQTAVGVQAAARIFFDKPVSQLDLEQSALLAGLPQAPSQYNPFRNPGVARQRRNQVLEKMAQLHYISEARAHATEQQGLQLHRGYYYEERRERFFFEYVRQQLLERYGAATVQQGGLQVYTTINLHLQDLARRAIGNVLNQPEDPASAIVTLNPANGDIEAMAESESYEKSQYNLAADGHRQPGSTFKAIDLADALSRGVDPNSTYYLSHTLEPGWLQTSPNYEVKTFEGTSLNKPLNLVQATLSSDNTVYAQLAADLGESSVTEMAYDMGVKTHLSSFPAEALGGLTLGVTPLEMAVVYATLADGGWRNTPIAITKVVFPDGTVDSKWGTPQRTKVLSDAVTAEETGILRQNVQSGTAVRSAINCPTAAKTGTTSELVDAWLDGYNPRYSTVVWMGYPNRRVSMTDVHGEPQQGGYLPAEIWHAYMAAVTEGAPCATFPHPNETLSYQPFYGKYAITGNQQNYGSESLQPHPETGPESYRSSPERLHRSPEVGTGREREPSRHHSTVPLPNEGSRPSEGPGPPPSSKSNPEANPTVPGAGQGGGQGAGGAGTGAG